ncbi:MAG TPA: hypothetical protein EYN66_05665 [Myxococcales bacterium]|nr:hypothetical protein [Myxococcales bacterium]
MPASTTIKNFRDGKITITDGAALNFEVVFESGDFSVSGLMANQKEATVYMDRGDFASIRYTNQTFPSGSFSAHFADLSDATNQTLVDSLTRQGSWSLATSTLGSNAEVYAVKMTLDIEGTDHGDTTDHAALDDCVCSVDFAEGDPNSVSISFTCYGAVTLT